MPDVTQLASGQIDGRETLQIILVQPYRRPALVQILWPGAPKPTTVDAGNFPNVASQLCLLFAEAHVTLAATKVHRRSPR